VFHGLDNVAGAGFALGADHGCAFADAAEGFAEVAAAADKGRLESGFGDVVDGVGGCEDFGFVDVVYAQGFEDLFVYSLACLLQNSSLWASLDLIFATDSVWVGIWDKSTYLALNEMSNSGLRHDGNRDCVHDLLDHLGVAHPCNTTLGANVGGHALERHDGYRASFFCYACLFHHVSQRFFGNGLGV
jgi:hypothetical protein